MTDGNRQYPVHILVLHHSAGPDFSNATDLQVQDWFSAIGKDRGYQGGTINPQHEHPSRKGTLTYSMAQFAGFPYDKDKNKYGYRLIDLMKQPWANVAWHAGNWEINIKSAGLENCGNYSNKKLAEKQLMAIADWLRPVDKELVAAGVKEGLTILLHQEIVATACPGKIKEQRNTLVDMINNPKKWNDKLWPPKAPEPKPSELDKLKDENSKLKARITQLQDQADAIADDYEREKAEWKAYKDRVEKEMSDLSGASIQCNIDLDKAKANHKAEMQGWHSAENGYKAEIKQLDAELADTTQHLETALKNAKEPAKWSGWQMIVEGIRRILGGD